MSWGRVFGKIADYIQGRDERRRNELDKLKRKYEELRKKQQTQKNTHLMSAVLKRIGVLESQNRNR